MQTTSDATFATDDPGKRQKYREIICVMKKTSANGTRTGRLGMLVVMVARGEGCLPKRKTLVKCTPFSGHLVRTLKEQNIL